MRLGSRILTVFVTVWSLMAISIGAFANQQTPVFEDEPLAQACQFRSLSELKLEAENVLNQFSKITNFDPFFWEADQIRREDERVKANTKAQTILEQKSQFDSEMQKSFSIFENLVASPRLQNFRSGFLTVDPATNCDLACTQGVFIGVNRQWVKLLSEIYTSSFEDILKFTIAHEIGHNVFDYNLWFSGKFSDIEAYRKHFNSLNYRKLHLTIDAIGMLLGNFNAVQVATFIEKTINSVDPSLGRGDIDRRIFCLRNLK